MRLKVTSFGDDAEGIALKGDPRNPEPVHTRIAFPGGDVDVVRTTDGEYWVHVRVNRKDITSYDPFQATAKVTDARADSHVRTLDLSKELADAYHFAVRVGDIEAPASR